MRKYFKSIKFLPLVLLTLAFACVQEGEDIISGQGANFMKLLPNYTVEAKEIPKLSLDLVPGERVLDLLDVRREDNSISSLSDNEVSVNIQVSDEVLVRYNTEAKAYNDDPENTDKLVYLELLPANLYKLSETSVKFGKNEFARTIKIAFDPTKLDPTKNYGIALKIANASSGYKLRAGGASDCVIQIVAKNRFDAVYTTTGTMTDFANAGLTGNYPTEMELVTDGALKVIIRDKALGSTNPFHSILNAGSISYYGAFGLAINFKEDNSVASIINVYGQPAANGRSAELDPSGVNKWDPATKTLKIKYWMNQPSVITPHRVSFDETFTFKAKR